MNEIIIGQNKMGERIRLQRLSNAMTMQELADKLKVGRSAVNKWEKGYVTNIKRATILEMARIFNCSPTWLMGIDDSPKIEISLSTQEAPPVQRRLRVGRFYRKMMNPAITNDERIFLGLFRQLNLKQQKAIISYMQFMIHQNRKKKQEVPGGIF